MKTSAYKWIATAGGAGYCPVAPGTAGALVGVGLWLIQLQITNYELRLGVALAVIALGWWIGVRAADALEPLWGKDPSRVVIDEVVGVWISLLAVPDAPLVQMWGYVAGAFVLFRFFDIVKPLGVRRMERLRGGIGVMADDVLAGVYGFIVLLLVRWVLR
jgi:phosphatidylglycerophosphatase A